MLEDVVGSWLSPMPNANYRVLSGQIEIKVHSGAPGSLPDHVKFFLQVPQKRFQGGGSHNDLAGNSNAALRAVIAEFSKKIRITDLEG